MHNMHMHMYMCMRTCHVMHMCMHMHCDVCGRYHDVAVSAAEAGLNPRFPVGA